MSYHVTPSGKRWKIHRTGGKRALALHDTQEEAWKEAQRLAKEKRAVAYLHGVDGRIAKRVDYGN